MEHEQDAPEHSVPEPVVPEPGVPAASSEEGPATVPSSGLPPKTRNALVLAAVLLVLPVIYLMVSHEKTTPVQSAPGQADATSISSLEALVQNTPTINNRINLSLAYINSGAPARAIPVLLAVVSEDKTNTVAWNNLCAANNMLKDYKDAIAACTEALRIDPNFQLAANNLKWAIDQQQKELAGKK